MRKHWQPRTYRSRHRGHWIWYACMFVGSVLLLGALAWFLAVQ